MKRKLEIKVRLEVILLLSIMLLSSLIFNYLSNNSNFLSNLEDKTDDEEVVTDINPIGEPKSSILGNDTWWDIDWHSRQLIVISNDNDVGLENFPVKIEFNYTKLVQEGKMNETCKDIRIIENGVLKKYYYQIDYPSSQLVTVWFENTVAKGPSVVEFDTYLYYDNMDIEIDETYFMNQSSADPANAYGWIRNGDFEWDPQVGSELTHFFGWQYSNTPPSDIDVGDGVQTAGSNEHALISVAAHQERVFEGDYSFKWGDTDDYVHITTILATGQDFEGRIYSYPFTIPTLTGNPSANLYITGYINVRSYTTQPQSTNGFLLRISDISNYDQSGSAIGTYEVYLNYGTDNKQTTETILNRLTGPVSFPATAETRNITESSPPFSLDGDLTGQFTDFDVTDWQGDTVFLEACTYGPETGKKRSVFAQIDDFKFNYNLDAVLETDIQQVQTEITVITKDVDGRIVPNANVSIVDTRKANPILRSEVTDSTGSAIFSNIGYNTYNFTVEYTLNTGQKGIVYDSTKLGEENFTFDESQSIYEEILILNMSTIDFEIIDWGGRPLDYGFINIKTSKNGISLENQSLDSRGTTTFRWFNVNSYYYEIYYNNTDYGNPIKLNESYILRSNYLTVGEKFQTHTFNVDEENILPAGPNYETNITIYTNKSSDLENKKIINFTVTLQNMDDFLTNVSIYYIDKSGSTDGNLIFSKTDEYTPSDNSDVISLTIRDPLEEYLNLVDDNYEVYGLSIIIKGVNLTNPCTGTITVDLAETWNVYNKTALARMNIQVMDKGIPVDVAKVFVSTGPPQAKSVVNLTSYVDKGPGLLSSDGWVNGRMNYLIPFWYFIGWSYNFTVTISGQNVDFKVNTTLNTTEISNIEQWKPANPVSAGNTYNVTMTYDEGILIFDVGVVGVVLQPQTKFENYIITEEVNWRENIVVSIYYNNTIDGTVWNPMPYTGNVFISFKTVGIGGTVYHTGIMQYGGAAGLLSYTLNSSKLTAGTDAQSYIVTIFADEDDYVNPSDKVNYTVVIALPTDLSLHDYSSNYDLIVEYTQYFGELLNISIKYYDNDTKLPIAGATLYYDWLNLGDIQFDQDPVNATFYTVTLDTTLTGSIGLKSIKITAYKENYTSQTNILISLRVLERPTSLNGRTDLVYSSSKIWVQDPHYYNFTYRDLLKPINNITGDLDIAIYSWQELDNNGNPIAGKSGSGNLLQNPDNTYTLDFNTEIKPVGFYQIYITLGEENYEERFALINLEIMLREFDATLDAKGLDDGQINIVKGDKVKLEIELLDETRGDIPLTGAKVVLEIGGEEYEFDEDDPGIYTYTFDTEEYEAFFTSQTLTGEIIIKKANFTTDEIGITIVVEMEEISEGVPTFYFIMVVAAITAVVGSLVSYRVIQQARIPKHVKRIREVKKKIKARDSIPKSLLVPSKEQAIIKLLGGAYSMLGVSLEETLGIKDNKSKTPPEIKDSFKQKGGET